MPIDIGLHPIHDPGQAIDDRALLDRDWGPCRLAIGLRPIHDADQAIDNRALLDREWGACRSGI